MNELRTAPSMFSQNPRWLPYHMTCTAHDTLACGGQHDHLTMQVWTFCRQALLSYGPYWVDLGHLNMLSCVCKWGHRSTNATYFGRPWLGPHHICTNSTLTKKWAQHSPKCVFRKSKMPAILHDLHSLWQTCMWGTTRPLDHASLNILRASIAKLQPMLSWASPCWVTGGGGGGPNIAKKFKILKMAWKI